MKWYFHEAKFVQFKELDFILSLYSSYIFFSVIKYHFLYEMIITLLGVEFQNVGIMQILIQK